MRILVVGGGGREHTLIWKLAQSPHQPTLYAAPGNPGIAEFARIVPIQVNASEELADFAESEQIDLTVVGPEVPLLAGIVDLFTERGLAIFGPTRAAAMIEGSKSFAKEIMRQAGIPTAKYASFTDLAAARDYVKQEGAPIVIKADGLAAGKGVVVAQTLDEAMDALDSIMGQRIFGEAGTQVVIEEFMQGEEATIMSFVDGQTIRVMAPSQDHKPVFDGDQGPNTGGMGTYSPVPQVNDVMLQDIERQIIAPAVEALAKAGVPFRGVLYTGLMLTSDGPKVVEFNARFGDPETQVVLPRLQSDLVDVLWATVDGRLADIELHWSEQAAVCVVMAAEGYPDEYRKGDIIHGLDVRERKGGRMLRKEETTPAAVVFHAGTKVDYVAATGTPEIVTAGGRVLGVTGFGPTLADARRSAYKQVEQVQFEGAHYRTDIASKAHLI